MIELSLIHLSISVCFKFCSCCVFSFLVSEDSLLSHRTDWRFVDLMVGILWISNLSIIFNISCFSLLRDVLRELFVRNFSWFLRLSKANEHPAEVQVHYSVDQSQRDEFKLVTEADWKLDNGHEDLNQSVDQEKTEVRASQPTRHTLGQ